MNLAIAFTQNAQGKIIRNSERFSQYAPGRPSVLIAAVDPDIRESLADLLRNYSMNSVWVDSVEDVKSVIAKTQFAACFCALWLLDGTYREIVRYFRRERMDIPVVIVSAPASPIEYRDNLAAMNIGALDCLCYPYEQSHFEAVLESAIPALSCGANKRSGQNERDLSRGA
jgi:DNA-binding NtrC family response regulator